MTTIDAGTSSEDSAAEEREHANFHQSYPQESISKNAPKESEKSLEESISGIYERAGGGSRAEIPDEEDFTHAGSPTWIDHDAHALPLSDRHSRKSRWRRNDNASYNSTGMNRKTCLRQLMLQWGKESLNRLVFNSTLPRASANVEAPNYVSWQYDPSTPGTSRQVVKTKGDLSIASNFSKDIITCWKSHGLPDSEFGLTRQLLKRVAAVAQNVFIGGSFLAPLALRYDVLDDSKYSVDKSCIFLSFPYFAVTKPQKKKAFQKGDRDHPVRALLQTHYRLIDTTDWDNAQSIRILEGMTLKQCIRGPEADMVHLSHNPVNELIHVPQMWALILGSNKLATIGPISDLALLGPSIKLNQDETPEKVPRCSFLRISFLNRRKIEELTYPLDHCASWFGLMNKYEQIRRIIGEHDDYGKGEDYIFQIGEHVIKSTTWASVQHSATEEVLDILMRTPVRADAAPANGDSDLHLVSADDRFHDLTEGVFANCKSVWRDTNSAMLEPAPVVLPFLAWPIKDEPDEPSQLLVTNRFLNTIYSSLPAICLRSGVDRPDNLFRVGNLTKSRLSTKSKISIKGKTALEVAELVRPPADNSDIGGYEIQDSFYLEMRRLFAYFVPKGHDENSAPIQLYWGAIYELLGHPEHLDELREQVEKINSCAEQIHRGVYYKRTVPTSHGEDTQQDAISGSARLLASMVDALGATFDMIVQAVHDARFGLGFSLPKYLRSRSFQPHEVKVSHYASNACKLLEAARNKLITESTGIPSGENIGSVLTPQAILILLTERLVGGVYGSGSVEITAIFDESLAQLALKVRSHANRRLLQILNAFEEEVTIIEDVLDQQQRVLLEFRRTLDPNSFVKPNTARKLRFDDETKAIDRVLHRIWLQKSACPELKQRAKALAVQNVQLVETLQDDNSRAILIFTLITVLFLPLSFVAGFFGMNVAGINPTTSTTRHFWAVALPLTGGILLLCAFILFVGEDFWFAFTDLPRKWWMKFKRREKR